MFNDKKITAKIEIHSSVANVWSVLTDFENMYQWSTSFKNLKGQFKEGGNVTAYYKVPSGKIVGFKHTLIEFEEGISFGWSDHFFLGVKDHHIFRLKQLPNGNTEFIQTDHFHKGAAWLIQLLLNKTTKNTYDRFNKELKERVESIFS